MLQKLLKPRNSPRLHVAFIDFSQAYDTVPRQQLWSHLRRSAMPSTLLSVSSICMRMMSTFLYMVRRGLGCIPQMVSNRGALCPPSFSLCTSMTCMGREISEGIEGVVTGDRVNCVSHMLYADDLIRLTTNDPGEMQTMLNRLRTQIQLWHFV